MKALHSSIKFACTYSIIFGLGGCLINPLGAQNLNFGVPFSKYYSSQEYNGGIQNWNITQNAKGLIYVANNFGLLEYDGTNWERYIVPSGTKIRDVYIGQNQTIYIASQGEFGYFQIGFNGRYDFISLADSLPEKYRGFDETWKVFGENGKIVFCTFNEVFVFDTSGKLLEVIHPPYAPENFFQVNHKIYINQLEEGLSLLSENKIVPVPGTEILKDKVISAILPTSNNRLLIATLNDGIYIYDGSQCQPWQNTDNLNFKSVTINTAILLKNGELAIGTQNNGLHILDQDGKQLMHLNKDAGMQNRTVLSLFEDINGNLWVGHNNGISYIELNLPYRHINEQSGLPGTGYAAFMDDKTLFLGTNNGLYQTDFSQPGTTNPKYIKNTDGQVYHISKHRDHILMGHHQGAFEIINNEARQITDVSGIWTFFSLPNNSNQLIAGYYKGLLLFERINGQIVFKRKIKGISESCRVMEIDNHQNIWMAHGYKGVYRMRMNDALDSVDVKYYGQKDGFPSNFLINVWNITNRLIFTSSEGIYRYDENTDSFVKDEFFQKHLGNINGIVKLAEDPIGNIYYISEQEVGVLKIQSNGDYRKETNIFNRIKGMLNDDLNNLSILNTNQVLFAAKEGFIFLNVAEGASPKWSFNTLIRQVRVGFPEDSLISTGIYRSGDKVAYEQDDTMVPKLSFDLNMIKIAYSAPFFDPQNKPLYQYRLLNLEKEWSEWTDKSEKEYNNLREGTYTFQVRSKNLYNQISIPVVYRFEILPPWYRTPISIAIYTILSVGVLVAGFFWLDRRYRKQTQALTEQQKIELKKKDSVLKSTEEKIEVLKTEKLKAEINGMNKELATSTMHLINKNEFINGMKHNLVALIKRSKTEEVKAELRRVINNIDKNIQNDKDWEHFAIHFDRVHGDFFHQLKDIHPDLSPQEMKLSAYLRMNLSTKEIAQLLNISVRGVEIARYRLRKKLDLERSSNLQEYILKI